MKESGEQGFFQAILPFGIVVQQSGHDLGDGDAVGRHETGGVFGRGVQKAQRRLVSGFVSDLLGQGQDRLRIDGLARGQLAKGFRQAIEAADFTAAMGQGGIEHHPALLDDALARFQSGAEAKLGAGGCRKGLDRAQEDIEHRRDFHVQTGQGVLVVGAQQGILKHFPQLVQKLPAPLENLRRPSGQLDRERRLGAGSAARLPKGFVDELVMPGAGVDLFLQHGGGHRLGISRAGVFRNGGRGNLCPRELRLRQVQALPQSRDFFEDIQDFLSITHGGFPDDHGRYSSHSIGNPRLQALSNHSRKGETL